MSREPTPEELEQLALKNQFPPERRGEVFNMGFNEYEPTPTDYTRSTIVYRCKATNTEEEARAKALAFLGERYGAAKAFRTARFWVFYIES